MVMAGAGNCGVVSVLMVVTFFVRWLFYCFRSVIVKCILFHGGCGIGGVVVVVGMMVQY